MAAARRCILDRGLRATGVRDIAAAAGVSVGTVTYHFASVNEVLLEVLRDASNTFTADVLCDAAARASALERLDVVIDAAFADSDSLADQWRLWIEYWAMAPHDPGLAALHEERYTIWRDAVEAIIADGVETGELAEVDPREATCELIALLDGLGLQASMGDSRVTWRDARRILRDATRRRLVGAALAVRPETDIGA